MELFANVYIQICTLNPKVALHSMLMALKLGPFIDSLYRRPPTNMDELRARAAGYIQMEEHAEFCKQAKVRKYDLYTPLNGPRVHILEEASNNDLITLPPPRHSPNHADKAKHCYYHKNYDHTTKECRMMRDQIEELVQGGHLGQFVQRSQSHKGGHHDLGRGRGRGRGSTFCTDQSLGSRQNMGNTEQPEAEQESGQAPLRGVINIIVGRFAKEGQVALPESDTYAASTTSTLMPHDHHSPHHL
ncbi:uncharacterized protein LOC109793552 [Cajanus cajan]|uniref:uncharacterized protein LOC109793552 n=1 Tax=Cajanus cajan TaxID=3821 RepID=UPI00098DD11A|nr:uncharacterized protein LOC109793552 [Cajanus cajan]